MGDNQNILPGYPLDNHIIFLISNPACITADRQTEVKCRPSLQDIRQCMPRAKQESEKHNREREYFLDVFILDKEYNILWCKTAIV